MKHLNLILICAVLSTGIHAQKVLTVENDTISGGNWLHTSKITNSYDASCYLISSLYQTWNAGTSSYDNSLLTSYTNNTDGTISQFLSQSWNGSSWVNLLRETFTYTAFGKPSLSVSEFYQNNNWQTISNTVYTYDNNHFLIVDSTTSTFVITQPLLKNLYTNNADGSPNQIIDQTWVPFPPPAKWKNAGRETITYYNNTPSKYLTIKNEIASGNNWENSDTTWYAYNGNGYASFSIEQVWVKNSSSWKNQLKNIFTYNGNNTLNTSIAQKWNANSSIWQDSSRDTYTYTNNNNCTLPITLLNFNAIKQNNKVQLSWKTASEVNTDHFNIQRSSDAVNFTNIGKVTAAGLSSSQMSYSFADDISQLKTTKVYYRLQQEDKDGKITLSNIAAVSISGNALQFLMLPNPARNYFTIIPDGNIDLNKTTISISSIAGKLLIQQKLNGMGTQRINISSLPKGIYIVSFITNGNIQTQKLVVE